MNYWIFPPFHSYSSDYMRPLLEVFVVSIIFKFISHLHKLSRRKKDIYGFELPDWVLNKEDQIIREIETDFESGLIANTLNKSDYSVFDFHSNLVNKNAMAYTGFIEMLFVKGFLLNILSPFEFFFIGHRHYSFKVRKKYGHRYFLGKFQNKFLPLLHLNSSSGLEQLKDEMSTLDTLLGIDNWQLIAFGDRMYVLAPELFDQEKMNSFLKLCLIIQSKI